MTSYLQPSCPELPIYRWVSINFLLILIVNLNPSRGSWSLRFNVKEFVPSWKIKRDCIFSLSSVRFRTYRQDKPFQEFLGRGKITSKWWDLIPGTNQILSPVSRNKVLRSTYTINQKFFQKTFRVLWMNFKTSLKKYTEDRCSLDSLHQK